jgi:hypothetical protein
MGGQRGDTDWLGLLLTPGCRMTVVTLRHHCNPPAARRRGTSNNPFQSFFAVNPPATELRHRFCSCKWVEQEENHENGLRWSWAGDHMGNFK